MKFQEKEHKRSGVILHNVINYRKLLLFVPIAFLLLFSIENVYSQSIPGTGTSAAICNDCVPTGWIDNGGTPDISDRNTASSQINPGGQLGGGATWASGPLPLPPSGDVRWITLRDVGPDFGEESVSAVMTGLVDGQLYELTISTMTSISNQDGPAGNGETNTYYAGTYMDQFDYEVDGNPRQTLTILTQETWSQNKFVFVASTGGTGNSTVTFYPRQDGAFTDADRFSVD